METLLFVAESNIIIVGFYGVFCEISFDYTSFLLPEFDDLWIICVEKQDKRKWKKLSSKKKKKLSYLTADDWQQVFYRIMNALHLYEFFVSNIIGYEVSGIVPAETSV